MTELYAVDDVAMEFEWAGFMYAEWPDDRIIFIPSSTDAELERCQRPCFDASENELIDGVVPPEAQKCCDKAWVPKVSFTNTITVDTIEQPRVEQGYRQNAIQIPRAFQIDDEV